MAENSNKPDAEALPQTIRINRLIALWALSEAALGGILHAFRIPFTGLVVNSSAVLFMVLIASASEKKGTVLRAMIIVIIIKGIISPHSPLAAYVAVAFQGIMGELLLRSKKHWLLSTLALGIITLFQSAVQKILTLTIVYGKVLWESVDIFGNFLVNRIPFLADFSEHVNFSLWLISIYIGIHLIAGIVVGIFAARVPAWLESEINNHDQTYRIDFIPANVERPDSKKRRRGLRKPSLIIILSLAATLFISSYLFPEISRSQGMKAAAMIVRAAFIMLLWYTLLGPLLMKLYRRMIKHKETAYAAQIHEAIDILPTLRYIIQKSWKNSRDRNGGNRLKVFVIRSLAIILTVEM